MNSFELRWYNGVLQYRYQYDGCIYAGLQPWPTPSPPVLQWSEWTKVKSVNDEMAV